MAAPLGPMQTKIEKIDSSSALAVNIIDSLSEKDLDFSERESIIFTAKAEEESIFSIFVCIGPEGAAKSDARIYVKNPSK